MGEDLRMREELNFREHFPNFSRSARTAIRRGGRHPLRALCGVGVQRNPCQLQAVTWKSEQKALPPVPMGPSELCPWLSSTYLRAVEVWEAPRASGWTLKECTQLL